MNRHKLPTSSLIITTYNWPKALEKSIKSTFKQSMLPNEIIIADDGSDDRTKYLIEKLSTQSPVPIIHIWHPDEGFKLSEIRNKAINAAKFDYIIQIDGDIIINKHFIKDHLHMAETNSFLCGSRVLLNQSVSSIILNQKNFSFALKQIPLGYLLNSLRIPFLGNLMADRYKRNKKTVLRGCNMSFWRKDLLAINGYNNDIQGWGSEDAELAIRLINMGVKKRFLKFMGIAFHIYHKESSKSNQNKNEQILSLAIKNKTTIISNGIIKN